jgi:hypothetical protein
VQIKLARCTPGTSLQRPVVACLCCEQPLLAEPAPHLAASVLASRSCSVAISSCSPPTSSRWSCAILLKRALSRKYLALYASSSSSCCGSQ